MDAHDFEQEIRERRDDPFEKSKSCDVVTHKS